MNQSFRPEVFCPRRSFFIKKNVPWHILAPSAVACDKLHLRASAHHWHVSAFLCNRGFQGISYYTKNRPPISRQTLPTFIYNFFLKYTLFPEFIFQFHIFPAIFHLFPAAVFALHFKPAARSLAVFLRGFFFDMCQLTNLPLYNLLFRSVHTYSLLNLFYYSAFL